MDFVTVLWINVAASRFQTMMFNILMPQERVFKYWLFTVICSCRINPLSPVFEMYGLWCECGLYQCWEVRLGASSKTPSIIEQD